MRSRRVVAAGCKAAVLANVLSFVLSGAPAMPMQASASPRIAYTDLASNAAQITTSYPSLAHTLRAASSDDAKTTVALLNFDAAKTPQDGGADIGAVEPVALHNSPIEASLAVTEYEFAGLSVMPKPLVTSQGILLTEGTDYTLTYNGGTAPGNASVTVEAIGTYTGSVTLPYHVVGNLADAVVMLEKSHYDVVSGGVEPQIVQVSFFGTPVPASAYRVLYENNTADGIGSVVLTAREGSGFVGGRDVPFLVGTGVPAPPQPVPTHDEGEKAGSDASEAKGEPQGQPNNGSAAAGEGESAEDRLPGDGNASEEKGADVPDASRAPGAQQTPGNAQVPDSLQAPDEPIDPSAQGAWEGTEVSPAPDAMGGNGAPPSPSEPSGPSVHEAPTSDHPALALVEVKKGPDDKMAVELSTPEGAPAEGWVATNDGSVYYARAGEAVTGRLDIDGETYVFADDGRLCTSWYVDPATNELYYLYREQDSEPTGSLAKDCWFYVSERDGWYVAQQDGAILTGWARDSDTGDRYYLEPLDQSVGSYGKMHTGWLNEPLMTGNPWYYLFCRGDDGEYGTLADNGWLNVGGDWYYCSETNGALETGWKFWSGSWYYLSPLRDGTYGRLQYGWFKDSAGGWYLSDPETGALRAGWQLWGNQWYYLSEELGDCGRMVTGWVWYAGSWYYLGDDGALLVSTITPDGCVVDATGRWVG